MKKIEISYFSPKRKDTFISDYKKYGIFIDTDCRIYFKNKKDAEKFLAEQNKELSNFLNEIVFYIKNIYSELWPARSQKRFRIVFKKYYRY